MSLHGNASDARVVKGNGAAGKAAALDSASSIEDFVGEWTVNLATGISSPFQEGITFDVSPDQKSPDSKAVIKFPQTTYPNVVASLLSGMLQYTENGYTTKITHYSAPNNTGALSGLIWQGDPEPVAVWGAEEGGGG